VASLDRPDNFMKIQLDSRPRIVELD